MKIRITEIHQSDAHYVSREEIEGRVLEVKHNGLIKWIGTDEQPSIEGYYSGELIGTNLAYEIDYLIFHAVKFEEVE